MAFWDITLYQIIYNLGGLGCILGIFAFMLYLINYIINWYWWKKENRKDLADLRFFLNHRDEIKKCVENSAAKKRGEL